VRATASPVHLVGHSFGGLVAIALSLKNLALARKLPLASLTVLEAPALALLREAEQDRHHYRSFQDMTDSYFAAFAGGDAEAIRLMIDFYGGPGTFASWPRRVRAYALETTAVNIRGLGKCLWLCAVLGHGSIDRRPLPGRLGPMQSPRRRDAPTRFWVRL